MIEKAIAQFYAFFAAWGVPTLIPQLFIMLVVAGIIIGFISLTVMFLIWWERKVSAHIQSRFGPMRVGGWHGWAQSIADGIKLLIKEDIIPAKADKWVFVIAPVVVFATAFSCYVVIPFGKGLIVSDLNIGILYIVAISSLTVVGIVMAGWASNNKYSLLGAMRSAAQVVSYEVPLVLSILGVVMLVGSLSMVKIVEAQRRIWFVVPQLLGFFIYLISAIAETNRLPFDIPEAESELVAGFHIEYSGMRFAMFFLAEYANIFTVSAIATTLFLGGWLGPSILPSWAWFLIKTYFILFTIMWLRWTLARLRVDQLMGLAWKVLLPLAFFNIAFTGLMMYL
ncbi:MAG: NADH-quinone oxidoreductase subunit NuoH [candidate division NC10 bacterium]|nr:NADH-quinone oxidoreductase subunit NuoH [candidate division NC10 bacterium]